MTPGLRRGSALPATALWAYSLAMAVWFAANWHESETVRFISGWCVAPADLVTLLAIAAMLRRGAVQGARRRAWALLAVCTASDLVATVVSARITPLSSDFYLRFSDWLYLPYYPLFSAALALLFQSCGGAFRRPQMGLDAATILVCVLATLWVFLFDLPVDPVRGIAMGVPLKIMYTLAIAVMATLALLLLMQILGRRHESSVLLLAGAAFLAVAADMAWLAQQSVSAGTLYVTDGFGDGIFSVCSLVYCALVASAARVERPREALRETDTRRVRNAYNMLPALTLLLSIALLIGSAAAGRGLKSQILIGIVLLSGVFLVARQRGVEREFDRLNRTLAAREAEARLTELVRCSRDLIAVADAGLRLGFVSPAAETMLGMRPADLLRLPAAQLLGAANEASLRAFLDELVARSDQAGETELEFTRPAGEVRVIRVMGSNQLANPLIEGISLTLSDVSEQRALERELLDIAIRERIRLCGDIHDGLGQELTGIALLLQTLSTGSMRGTQTEQGALREVVGYVNGAIRTVRKLALGLSPVHTDRDSLCTALQSLAAETSSRLPVDVLFDTVSKEPWIDATAADHLYRIAQESINNALRHSGCSAIRMSIDTAESGLTLAITDDGCGFDSRASGTAAGHLGLRMMKYRARVVGGGLQIATRPQRGTRIAVTVPFGRFAGPPADGRSRNTASA